MFWVVTHVINDHPEQTQPLRRYLSITYNATSLVVFYFVDLGVTRLLIIMTRIHAIKLLVSPQYYKIG